MATRETLQRILSEANQSEWFAIYLKVYALGMGTKAQEEALLEVTLQCMSVENGNLYLPELTERSKNLLALLLPTGRELDNDLFRATVLLAVILGRQGNEFIFLDIIDPMKRTQELIGLVK